MKREKSYNLLTLKFFDKALEAAYREDDFFKGLKKYRTVLLEIIFLYTIFAILDLVLIPEQKEICWIIRFFFVCPLVIGAYLFSFKKRFRRFQTATTLLVGFFCSVGIILMIAIAPSPANALYYAGLLLCSLFFYGKLAGHLVANCLSWGTFFLYLTTAALFTSTPGTVLFSNTFIYFFFNFAGMFTGYTLELSKRMEYLQRLTIERQTAQLERALEETERERRRAEELSLQDPLTGLANRRHFFNVAAKEYERKLRYRHNLSIVLLDIDHFKTVNDTFGHSVGDLVLKKVASIITNSIRKSDLACRYGGEEFAILLPETDPHTAKQLGERLRQCVEQAAIFHEDKKVPVSASLGIAGLTEEESVPPHTLLERADQMLYQAKNSGRNCLYLWDLKPEKTAQESDLNTCREAVQA